MNRRASGAQIGVDTGSNESGRLASTGRTRVVALEDSAVLDVEALARLYVALLLEAEGIDVTGESEARRIGA